jgi:hypothetical protein
LEHHCSSGHEIRGGHIGDDGKATGTNYSAVAINLLRLRGLLIVIENCRDQNFDQLKENEQRANQKENVGPGHVWQPWQLRLHRQAISDQC